MKTDRDFIDYDGPSKSYIFIVKPRTIFDLFERFKYSLFFKNVRNPLLNSTYNKAITETLKKRPGDFWYFNNGITAITKFIPDVGIRAEQIDIRGLQVINGAQTVYSIYLAYKSADELQRQVMDADARITLRLIRSSNEKFNLEITKYTNSQNEVKDSDFMSNDEVQIRLQNESFNTNVWYSKRRGEFIKDSIPKRIRVVSNSVFVYAYVAFFQQKPLSPMKDSSRFFISCVDDNKGLYESIFNDNIKFIDMLAAYYIYNDLLMDFSEKDSNGDEKKIGIKNVNYICMLHVCALTKVILEMYFKSKNGNDANKINVSLYIVKAYEKEDEKNMKIISNVFDVCTNILFSDCENNESTIDGEDNESTIDSEDNESTIDSEGNEKFMKIIRKLAKSTIHYDMLVEELKNKGLDEDDVNYIENENSTSKEEAAVTK
nr:AIPR family protein [Clostridium beijerinckii]